jgi:ferredoxin-nitrite reductase
MACDGTSTLQDAPLDGFTDTQRAYLEQLLAELDLAAVFKPAPATDAAATPLTVHGTAVEDLTTQERLKLDMHPWDLWPRMQAHANDDRLPDAGDTFMFKHHGMFNVQPAQPGFMCRLRIPACRLRGDQLAGLADLTDRLAGGYAHVTTRGNLQIRQVPPRHIIDVLHGLYDLGLTSKGSGADSVRNITCNPTAGFDPHEVIDLSPLAIRLHHLILNSRDLHGIPRKFNIAFDGGGTISAVADTNDIGFVAHRLRSSAAVACRILLGGITGHGDFARDTGYACTPEQTIDVSVAMLKVFIEHADRTNRKRARLKYLLDDWGFARFIAETRKHLPFDLMQLPQDATEPRRDVDRQAHIGVHPQRERDRVHLGVALTLGRLSTDQMRGIADISRRFGRNDLRLTVWQNLLIPHVHASDVDAAVGKLREIGLGVDASAFATGVVACTGRFGCQYASAHTKEHAAALVEDLAARFDLDQPINIHLTGCPHSCAQHYIGDIGLLGASTPDGREAYHVYLGGGVEHDRGLARRLTGPIAADQLNGFIAGLIQTYLSARLPGETFLAFTRRHDEEALRSLFLPDAQPADLMEVAW